MKSMGVNEIRESFLSFFENVLYNPAIRITMPRIVTRSENAYALLPFTMYVLTHNTIPITRIIAPINVWIKPVFLSFIIIFFSFDSYFQQRIVQFRAY